MKLIVPNYYTKFKCIAGLCKHSCCIGWEIDIDEDTLEYYKSVDGDFGVQLTQNIKFGETPCFKLGEHERCPFLNKNNLCDIILNLGENALCQICSDHPRFRNFYDNRTEIGLGLCCEAACKLILERKEKVYLTVLEDDGDIVDSDPDNDFLEFRENIFSAAQDRSISFKNRASNILNTYEISFPRKTLREWIEIYVNLEQLDSTWGELLHSTANTDSFECHLSDTVLEQLFVYFIFRHLAESIYDGRIKERIAFALLSTYIICAVSSICRKPAAEIARMYSSEIEYSEDNIEKLLDILTEEYI